ncbi:MAG TPA: flagellar biosynthesis protein FliQ [Arsenophonus sp.]
MTPETVIGLAIDGLKVTLALAASLLLAALLSGLIVSLLQAATQINEMTLSFIPKIIAVFITAVLADPWMLELFIDYNRQLITQLSQIIG